MRKTKSKAMLKVAIKSFIMFNRLVGDTTSSEAGFARYRRSITTCRRANAAPRRSKATIRGLRPTVDLRSVLRKNYGKYLAICATTSP